MGDSPISKLITCLVNHPICTVYTQYKLYNVHNINVYVCVMFLYYRVVGDD